MMVTLSAGKAFPGADVYNILEVVKDDGTCYWLSIQMKDWLYRVQLSANGRIMRSERHKVGRP
jgi:hypothetical protein